MSKRTDPTQKWYKEYQSQYARIRQAIGRAKKAGYVVPDSIKPIAPSKVGKITKRDINRLAKITPESIRQQSTKIKPPVPEYTEEQAAQPTPDSEFELDPFFYPDDPTEIPTEHLKYFPSFNEMVITTFINEVRKYPSAVGAKMLENWINDLVSGLGQQAVAEMLQRGAENGLVVESSLVYDATLNRVFYFMTDMMDFLPNVTEQEKKAMSEIMEQEESWDSPK